MAYQAIGHGYLPVFIGRKTQRGHGIASIFSSLARNALPILSSIGKKIAPTMINRGANFLTDVITGAPPKKALKRHLKEAGKDVIKSFRKPRKSQKGGGVNDIVTVLGKRKAPEISKQQKKRRKITQLKNILAVVGSKGRPPGRKPKSRTNKNRQRSRSVRDIFS